MYKKELVNIPIENKGKIVKRQMKNYVSIMYQFDSGYNKDTAICSPKRSIIGKAESMASTQMYPNDNFYKIYGSKFDESDSSDTSDCSYRSGALKIGTYCVIEKIMNEYNLQDYLSESIVDDNGFDNSGLLKDLLSYFIINENNDAILYPEYAFNHPLFSKKMHIYSDSTISRYYENLKTEQRLDFMAKWNKNKNKNDKCYISYDSTNKNIRAGDISFAEWGHSKVDRGYKIFNLAIGFDITNSVPLTYEVYNGSIADCKQLPIFLDNLKANGYSNIGVILDRGYFTEQNIKDLENKYHYDYIIMIKDKEKIISDLILNNSTHFKESYKYLIPKYDVYGINLKAKLFSADEEDKNIFLYFSPSKMVTERKAFLEEIAANKKLLDSLISDPRKNKDIYFEGPITDYFDIKYNKDHGILMYTEKIDEIDKVVNTCGYFALVSSENLTAEKCLVLYKGRDASEKLFNQDKTGLGADTEGINSNETLQGKLFIEFIALIVRNRMYSLLKTQKIKNGANYNYYNVPEAIAELEKIEMVRQPDGIYTLGTVVTKLQRAILSCFGMDDTDILKKANEIKEKLRLEE